MAHKKAGGSTSLGRDSQAKRLGVKMVEGQLAYPGCILIRQRGTKFFPGLNVKKGGDDTLYATATGIVKFSTRKRPNFHGKLRWIKIVNVIPKEK
jgi:large subunit ribosomal protein L27